MSKFKRRPQWAVASTSLAPQSSSFVKCDHNNINNNNKSLPLTQNAKINLNSRLISEQRQLIRLLPATTSVSSSNNNKNQIVYSTRTKRIFAIKMLISCLVFVAYSLATLFGQQMVQAQSQVNLFTAQQQYQRSPMLHQQQQQTSLVNSNGLHHYQNDQPQAPQQQPQQQQQQLRSSNLPAPSFYAESSPFQGQQFQSTPSVDLDNAIESTTSTVNKSPQAFEQAFPLISSAVQPRPIQSQQQQQQQQTCQLPLTWAGKWYQANKDPIRVTNTEISDKGICRDKKGDKYLFKQAHQTCLTCLVINERHLNVLQYKESNCQPIPAQYLNRSTGVDDQLILDSDHSLLDAICSDITGDAQLESLFRLDTPATECPINGKYHFTYDSCHEPLSSLDSCIDKKQLNFKFSACPDVPGSESKSEVLKCYADWSEGNNYYMIGRLEHASNHQDKGKFRCFVYEKMPDGEYIQMAQSLEESCYGLINANEGPKTLRLTPRQTTAHKCHLPSYIHSQSENWLSVDNSLIYMFNQNSTKYQVKETKEGNIIEEATCLQQFTNPPQAHPHSLQQVQSPHLHHHQHQARSNSNQQVTTPTSRRYPPSSNNFNQIDQSPQQAAASSTRQAINDVVYLVQITKNCYTTDYCVRFYRRTSGIVQIDYFIALPGTDGQQRCRNAYIGTPQTQIITSTNLEQQRCPFDGAYTIEAPPESDFSYNPSNIFICPRQSYLTAQCDHPSRLRIHYRCSPAKYMIKNLYCLGSWTTNGLVRLLLADDERQRYSSWYRDYGAVSMAATTTTAQQHDDHESTTASSQPQGMMTRSQQLIGLSPSAANSNQFTTNSLASIVDLQIALVTSLPTVSKPMQVRLTRRSQCSDLRGYTSQSSFSSMSSSSVPSYASPSASSSAATSVLSSIVMFQATTGFQSTYSSTLILMIVMFFSLSLTTTFATVTNAITYVPMLADHHH